MDTPVQLNRNHLIWHLYRSGFVLLLLGFLWSCGTAPSDTTPKTKSPPKTSTQNPKDKVPSELTLPGLTYTLQRPFSKELPLHPKGESTAIPNEYPTRTVKVERRLPFRGITMSCPRAGAIWATEGMRTNMAEVQQLGSNWITFHPYARVYRDGSLRFDTSTNQSTVMTPMRYKKELGMKIMLKPHIAYWGSGFSWRGAIVFKEEAHWQRFFNDYTRWMVVQAKMAQAGGAEIFSMGLEYKLMEHREEDWRKVIAAVRKVYKGKILYSANWDTYDKVKFWDALDYIGIQAYFPISQKTDPSEEELVQGWKKVLTTLEKFSNQHKKPIIFTELGYNYSAQAAAKPWDYQQGGPNAGAIKLRCMKVALEQLHKPKFIHGVFLWKWFPDSRISSRDFILQYPEMKKVISNAWK